MRFGLRDRHAYAPFPRYGPCQIYLIGNLFIWWNIVSVVPNVLVRGSESIILQVAIKGVKYDSIDGILLTGCFIHNVSFCVFNDFVTSTLKCKIRRSHIRGRDDLQPFSQYNGIAAHAQDKKAPVTIVGGKPGIVAELGKDVVVVWGSGPGIEAGKTLSVAVPRIVRLQFLTAYAGLGKVVGALSISGGRYVGLINPAVEMVSGSGMMIV
ncbi:hypothetical protein EV363DRAFT_1420017 [Boletus edulis]|nr:hypothetical protein EV363DRAFT_1420017 [Boletus edulis]